MTWRRLVEVQMYKVLTAHFIFSVLTFGGSLSMAASEVVTAPFVDLKQYVGKWYEVASIPQSFQKKCVSETTAEYSLGEKGLIKVLNSCQTKDGSHHEAEGRARIEDPVSNSKLRVTFVKFIGWIFLFGGDYWVVDLASDYSYAVVGDPTRKYAWILSRTPALNMEVLSGIEKRLVQQGYDTSKVLTSIQSGGFNSRVPLDEAVKN